MKIGLNLSRNVLTNTQTDVATHFSKTMSSEGREMSEKVLQTKDYSIPSSPEGHARFHCELVNLFRRELSTIYFDEVRNSEFNAGTMPLMHYRRIYCRLESIETPENEITKH